MTISTTTTRVDYTGNGVTTAFAVSYIFYDADDLDVIERTIATGVETVLTRGVDYTVSGGNGSTGTVTATTAPASTKQWTIIRNTARTQTTDLTDYGPFPANTVEQMADRGIAIAQELDREFARAVLVPATDTAGMTLPSSVARAGKLLGFDGSGEPVMTDGTALGGVVVSAYGATLVDDADAATARATLGLGSAALLAASAIGTALVTAADAAAVRTAISVIPIAGGTYTGAVGFGDVGHYLSFAAGAATYGWDTDDYMTYDRAANTLSVIIGTTARITLTATSATFANDVAVTGGLTVAGAGGVSVTTGNVALTSGSVTAPTAVITTATITTLNTGTAVTSATAAGAVGSFVFATYGSAPAVAYGGTTAGSNLTPSNAGGTATGSALSGTWRCLGEMAASTPDRTLWLRIA